MNFVEVLKECESASGAGSKKVIQAALAKLDPAGRSLVWYALNPYLVFGVKKFDRPTSYAAEDGNIDIFTKVLISLACRHETGDAARELVTNAMANFTKETASYLERVLEKDLKCGFSAETYNKLWPGEAIPIFDVMLADKCEDTEDFEKYVTFPCQADFKLDGERTIAIVRQEKSDELWGLPSCSVAYYSRSGKEAKHIDGLFDEELTRLRNHLGYDFVLDAERFANSFTETVNAKKEGNDEAKNNLRLHAIFLMPLYHWIDKSTDITMRQSRKELEEALCAINAEKILLTGGREVADYADMMSFCNEAIDKHKVEGLILKDWNATYQWDRTFAWTKVKRFYDVDARIVSFYPGRPKTRFDKLGVPGGANCVAFLESGERVEFKVGSGFSDKDRESMRDEPEKWIEATHVIKYQEVSRAKNKEVASLRFCTYERTRDDKLVEVEA